LGGVRSTGGSKKAMRVFSSQSPLELSSSSRAFAYKELPAWGSRHGRALQSREGLCFLAGKLCWRRTSVSRRPTLQVQ
jgi:hypothetical protein